MATRIEGTGRRGAQQPDWRAVMRESLWRSFELIAATALLLFVGFLALAFVSYQQTDPSPSTAAAGPPANLMGWPGAWFSERLLFFFGWPATLLLPYLTITALRLWRNQPRPHWGRRLGLTALGMVLIGIVLTYLTTGGRSELPSGWGGLLGQLGHDGLAAAMGSLSEGARGWIDFGGGFAFLLGGAALIVHALGLERATLSPANWRVPNLPKFALPRLGRGDSEETGDRVIEAAPLVADPAPAPAATLASGRPVVQPDRRPPPEIADPATRPTPATLGPTSRQGDFFGNYNLPSVDLLTPAGPSNRQALDKLALERNARLLESVLADFRVQGEIKAVRPGPVVTLYELEPAPGVKARRVIDLAGDIARNMSALSARVSIIPGRTVMGIELPNAERDPVVLHEMVASHHFADHKGKLPVILGKNISGDPVIADLAPMPHLLVAGTTGSGKSVGLNCMILSLLYRMTPDQCRLIMIDPKMLELSTYDDIPHLLAPVVTEPAKAIRALKWAVEQMEERYRMMANLSVRSLANFNDKVTAAKSKGRKLGRRVQTGYDPDTKQPIYEEEELDYDTMPQIVIVVDELADLMMTAGKEVEFLIQRLAQKARAAGIHLIMATQRPSVDVITGVIKANLPTRISFHVTSKIDSRTILGEQGAEQLLGKGDMLYMPGGKALTRVHGPFVSDDEVRAVADFWRAQGAPDYIQAVTEEPEDGGFALDGVPLDDDPEDQLFRKACQLVFESQKASTSWLQRQLRVGYNSAARLIERMEDEGFVSAANHVGRREVLRDREGNPV